MRLSDSTRRTVRTVLQAILALVTVTPALDAGLSWLARQAGAESRTAVLAVSIIAGLAAVTKAVNYAEERGWIRAVLKEIGPRR